MINLERYNYAVPPSLIRKRGVSPRDHARLFIYDTARDTITHDRFYNLVRYLPRNTLLVLNNTKVVPARLWLKKESGGKIEVFVLANEMTPRQKEVPFLVDRKCAVGKKIFFPNGAFIVVRRQEKNKFFGVLHGQTKRDTLSHLLARYGATPIPHYLDGADVAERTLRTRYQTIFAKSGAAVAAPTAALHFTPRVFASLAQKKIVPAELTLNVGRGTFAPVREENFQTNRLHAEHIIIAKSVAEKINRARARGNPIAAVGTTSIRALETAFARGSVRPFDGETTLFVYPPHRFHVADILLTNFHLPQSSLMLLVDAFLQHKKSEKNIGDLYAVAIQEKYAFYSFGDSMLIL